MDSRESKRSPEEQRRALESVESLYSATNGPKFTVRRNNKEEAFGRAAKFIQKNLAEGKLKPIIAKTSSPQVFVATRNSRNNRNAAHRISQVFLDIEV